MRLDRFLADVKLRGDLFVRHPLHHPCDDLTLPVGQGLLPLEGEALEFSEHLTHVLQHLSQHLALYPQLSSVYGVNSSDEIALGGRLWQVPHSALLQSFGNAHVHEHTREDQDMRLGAPGAQGREDL